MNVSAETFCKVAAAIGLDAVHFVVVDVDVSDTKLSGFSCQTKSSGEFLGTEVCLEEMYALQSQG